MRIVSRQATAPGVPEHTACLAPETALYFMTNGDVRSCCMNDSYPLGNVAEQGLGDIWAGSRRRDLADHLRVNDFSLGCQSCDWQTNNEDGSSYARRFDEFAADARSDGPDDPLPARLEFNLSNSCNLQCIQCEGELSSSIRIHREKRPAMPRVYDDQFFADVVPFLAHAKQIQVAGGEPFLGPESMRLLELMAEHAPQAERNVVTNGTQWNRRVEAVLDSMPLDIAISIDGITKDIYESIRVGSDLDLVLANIERFGAYTKRVGTSLTFTFCLMVQNYTDFPKLLLFAEARGILVSVSPVYHPVTCSLNDLDADELGRVCDELEAQSASVLPQLRRNAKTWNLELTRLRQWHRARVAQPTTVPAAVKVVETPVSVIEPPTYILGFEQQGAGPADDDSVMERLGDASPGQALHWVSLVAGDRIAGCSPGAPEALGLREQDLVGEAGDTMRELMEARLGAITGFEVLEEDADHRDQVITYGTTPMRAVAVALRDDNGWADEVRLVFATPPTPLS